MRSFGAELLACAKGSMCPSSKSLRTCVFFVPEQFCGPAWKTIVTRYSTVEGSMYVGIEMCEFSSFPGGLFHCQLPSQPLPLEPEYRSLNASHMPPKKLDEMKNLHIQPNMVVWVPKSLVCSRRRIHTDTVYHNFTLEYHTQLRPVEC